MIHLFSIIGLINHKDCMKTSCDSSLKLLLCKISTLTSVK